MSFDEKHEPKADEAAYDSVSAPSAQEEPISHEERLLVRKLDRRILPIACLMYLFACLSSRISCSHRFHYCDSRFGQKQLGQRSSTGPTCGYTRRRSYGQEVRLGQFRLFLLLCEQSSRPARSKLEETPTASPILHRFYVQFPPPSSQSSSNLDYFWVARLSVGAFAPRSWLVVFSHNF